MTPISSVIERILIREGGVAQLPGEPFVTRFGQTPSWLETFHLPPPETREQAAVNYAAWLVKTGLDAVVTVDDALANVIVDWAVHAGHGRAIRALQTYIGARPDGVIGPETIAKLDGPDRDLVARLVLADRIRHLGVLLADPSKSVFARGWMNRVAEQVAAS